MSKPNPQEKEAQKKDQYKQEPTRANERERKEAQQEKDNAKRDR